MQKSGRQGTNERKLRRLHESANTKLGAAWMRDSNETLNETIISDNLDRCFDLPVVDKVKRELRLHYDQQAIHDRANDEEAPVDRRPIGCH